MKDYIKNIQDAERRFITEPVGFQKRVAGEAGDSSVDENVIEGYAAVFNKNSEDFGGWHERIAPGAFSDVLNDDAVVLFNHDMNLVLGRNKVNATFSEDERGLKYTVKLPDTSLARDLRNLIKDGIIHQSSFAFTVADQAWTKEGDQSVRTIKKIKRLYDGSPVTTPAYPDATIGARAFEANKPKDEEPRLTADLMGFKILINKNV